MSYESPFKYRVLIVGESGVGKSSLIKKAFGVHCDINHLDRGQANIEQEFVTNDDRFVVHDSRGFEAAEEQNMIDAHNFIKDRKSRPEKKDQLHAVWLCLEIPYAGARLIERAGQSLLDRREEILGDIPIILVFSKHDLLVNLIEAESLLAHRELPDDEREAQYKELMWKLCLTPMEKKAKGRLPHITVSSRDGYEETLEVLREKTAEIIHAYLNGKPIPETAVMARPGQALVR